MAKVATSKPCPDGCFNKPARWTVPANDGDKVVCKVCGKFIGYFHPVKRGAKA